MSTDPHATVKPPLDGEKVLALQLSLSATVSLVVTVVYVLVGGGEFWPVWVWHALGLAWGWHWAVRRALAAPDDDRRPLRLHAAISGVLAISLVVIWVLSGPHLPWIWWVLGSLLVVYGAHSALLRHGPDLRREQELTERVDELTRTRRGALDVQAAELRRIERDLHDGAQARLVALTMQLGRAEAQLEGNPEVAALVRAARDEAGAAIAELRDLARGIAPPILADRGLGAALESLAQRAPVAVAVVADLPRRPPPVLENAAYFVAAESLTNVAKHAPAASARVSVTLDDDRLVVEVADDGPGGANAGGSGLTGLRHRVEALDGTLLVTTGRGTVVRAELPCAS